MLNVPFKFDRSIQTRIPTKPLLSVFAAIALCLLSAPTLLAVEQGDDNPTGVAGVYNGQITTAGNYDPFTGNAHREIDDIVVPGGVGKYPLKWSRYWNAAAGLRARLSRARENARRQYLLLSR